jgi:hypothetical protein
MERPIAAPRAVRFRVDEREQSLRERLAESGGLAGDGSGLGVTHIPRPIIDAEMVSRHGVLAA